MVCEFLFTAKWPASKNYGSVGCMHTDQSTSSILSLELSFYKILLFQTPFFFVVSCKNTMVNLLKWALALIFSHSHLFTVSQNCISALTYAKSLQKYPLTHDISKVSRVENFCLKSSDQSKESCSNIYTNQFFGLLFCITQDFIMWLFQNSIWH